MLKGPIQILHYKNIKNKEIVLFCDRHGESNCMEDGIEIQIYIQNLIKSLTDVDVFIEFPYVDKFDRNYSTLKRLTGAPDYLSKVNNAMIDKLFLENQRVHYFDIRRILRDKTLKPLIFWEMGFNLKLDPSSLHSNLSMKEMQSIYKYMVGLLPKELLFDFTKRDLREEYKLSSGIVKDIAESLSLDAYMNDLILKEISNQLNNCLISNEVTDYWLKRFENFYTSKDLQLGFGRTLDYKKQQTMNKDVTSRFMERMKWMLLGGALTETYAWARMFRRNPEMHNIIYYAGANHSLNTANFLHSLGFEPTIYKQKKEQCIDIKDFVPFQNKLKF